VVRARIFIPALRPARMPAGVSSTTRQRADQQLWKRQSCTSQPKGCQRSACRGDDCPLVRLQLAQEVLSTLNFHDALSFDKFLGIDCSCFFFDIQVRGRITNRVDCSSSKRGLQNKFPFQPMLLGPPSHDPFVAKCGINERAIHVEQDGVTAEFYQKLVSIQEAPDCSYSSLFVPNTRTIPHTSANPPRTGGNGLILRGPAGDSNRSLSGDTKYASVTMPRPIRIMPITALVFIGCQAF
jgi:hypothetical protein